MIQELFTPLRETWLYRVNPAFKFVVLFCLLVGILFIQHMSFIRAVAILFTLLLVMFSGYSLRRLLLFSIPIVLSFVSSALTMTLFGKGETIWWSWGLIKISKESFSFGLLLGFKTMCFGVVSLLFLLTTRPLLFFYAMMQQLRFPPKYAYSFIASIRLLPVIVEELQTRSNALRVRGVQFSKGMSGMFERMKAYSVPLFAQSIRRAQRIAVAMEAKRFQMTGKRTYYYPTSYSKMDILFGVLTISLVICSYFLSK